MYKTIQTNRLEIKPYKESDQSELTELLTNREIKKSFILPDFQTEEEIIRMVKKLQRFSCSDDHFERGIYLNDRLIGFVNDVVIENDVIELGYVIHPAFHNKGYATEMLKAVIDELFRNGFSKIVTGAFEDNLASIQVMKKCGMSKMDKEEDIFYGGRKQRCVYYSIHENEYAKCVECQNGNKKLSDGL